MIIIGTGAGGGTLARHLAPSGKRILLLERGDWLPREPENWSTVDQFAGSRGSQSPRSSSRIRLPEGARWRASVPPPAPVPMMITSYCPSMLYSFRGQVAGLPVQKMAIGLMGEPVAARSRRGATTQRNDQRFMANESPAAGTELVPV